MANLADLMPLLKILEDGQLHSGTTIGQALGISRNAVWKQLNKLKQQDIEIESIPSQGHRILKPLDLLSKQTIKKHLSETTSHKIDTIEVLPTVTSTNQHLLEVAKTLKENEQTHICIAEQQTQGRGRRGKNWHSPFGRNLYLSCLQSFDSLQETHGALSLVIGVATIKALEKLGVEQIGLKWPNDIVWKNTHKLAGILIELTGSSPGPWHTIIGLGLNIDMASTNEVQTPWTSLANLIQPVPKRSYIAATLITAIIDALDNYRKNGFTPYLKTWQQYDVLQGQQINIHTNQQIISGRYLGISPQGAIQIQQASNDEIQTYHCGEVSVRAQK